MAQPQSIAATPAPAPAPDPALIAAWQEGDEQAAAELVRRHTRALARFLAGAGAPEADLEDLVQEAFIRAFRAVNRFRGQCQFRTWLLTIGGNVLKDHGRRAARHKVVPLDEGLDGLAATGGDPHQQAEAGEAEGRLALGVGELPRLQREVFLLRAQQGLEYDEIAAALDTTTGAARVHYHHAVKRLKEMLQ
jgi:RNA polymerase sigma-70 factor (ECF subfamily)